jgi:hypothetical protein
VNHTIKSVRRLQECEIAQRMHDIAQKQIVASESSIDASESSTIVKQK